MQRLRERRDAEHARSTDIHSKIRELGSLPSKMKEYLELCT